MHSRFLFYYTFSLAQNFWLLHCLRGLLFPRFLLPWNLYKIVLSALTTDRHMKMSTYNCIFGFPVGCWFGFITLKKWLPCKKLRVGGNAWILYARKVDRQLTILEICSLLDAYPIPWVISWTIFLKRVTLFRQMNKYVGILFVTWIV